MHSALTSSTPATPFHLSSDRLVSSQSFSACSFCPSSSRARIRVGVCRTHRTVSRCFALSTFTPCASRPDGRFPVRSCSETAKAVAVSAMCVMAGPSIEVVGMRGSIFDRICADTKGGISILRYWKAIGKGKAAAYLPDGIRSRNQFRIVVVHQRFPFAVEAFDLYTHPQPRFRVSCCSCLQLPIYLNPFQSRTA